MNKTAPFKKSGTPLLAALLLASSAAHAGGDAWPQPEAAYNSTQPRAQWLDTTPDNSLPQPVAPQQLMQQPQYPAGPPASPYTAPVYGGYPTYGYAPRGYAPPAYGYGYGYAPRQRNNRWWPGNGNWPNMNNWSMPSPSFSTPSFSMPSNPFGW